MEAGFKLLTAHNRLDLHPAGIYYVNYTDEKTCCVCCEISPFSLSDILLIKHGCQRGQEAEWNVSQLVNVSVWWHSDGADSNRLTKAACPCGRDPAQRRKRLTALPQVWRNQVQICHTRRFFFVDIFAHLSSLLILSSLFSSYHIVSIYFKIWGLLWKTFDKLPVMITHMWGDSISTNTMQYTLRQSVLWCALCMDRLEVSVTLFL